LAFRRVFVARRFPFNYTVTRFHKHKEKPYGKVIPKASEGVEPMFEKNKGLAAVFFLAGIILWIITDNVVFIILVFFMFAEQKRALLD